MESFLTVLCDAAGEYTEKRSKFLAVLHPCETEEDAASFLAEIRARHREARHNCYAYCVADGRAKRFSDDSEPHGTAGKPILEVIEGADLYNVVLVVTRYFGGILLGTGGLARAYTEAAKQAVASAKIVRMTPCCVFRTVCPYSDVQRLAKLIETAGGKIETTDYAADVTVTYYLESDKEAAFLTTLQETFSARLSAEKTEEKRLPMPAGGKNEEVD